MPTLKHIAEEASVVLAGSFNPKIFHPEWLLRRDLISEHDETNADVEVVHNELAKFHIGWCQIEVLHERFTARTNDASRFDNLRDLVASIFQVLEHTPMNALGMNRKMIFRMESEDLWHKVGHKLAPKDIWQKTLPNPVGLTSLGVMSPRVDGLPGKINVIIKPALEFCIEVSVNSHIDLTDEVDQSVSDLIVNNWSDSMEHSFQIAITTIAEAMK